MGQLIDVKKTEYDSKVYSLVNEKGESYYFFGCHKLDSVLPTLMSKYVRITYKGKVKLKNKKTLREFDVEIWKDEEGKPPEGFEEDVPF